MCPDFRLSGIVIAYLKIAENLRILPTKNTKGTKIRKKIWEKCFFSNVRVCARGQNFLVFEALAIFRPLSND